MKLSGRREQVAHLPDGEFLPPIDMNCVEDYFAKQVALKFHDRLVTPARVANLTESIHGRGPCQYRNLCTRGCPFGGYFSSNASTLPAAMATGNLTLRPFSIVPEVIYDKDASRAIGVRIIDTNTQEVLEYFAKIIFLNASTIATAAILLNSKSDRFPEGLGNSSGQVGRNLMDHFQIAGAEGELHRFRDRYYSRSDSREASIFQGSRILVRKRPWFRFCREEMYGFHGKEIAKIGKVKSTQRKDSELISKRILLCQGRGRSGWAGGEKPYRMQTTALFLVNPKKIDGDCRWSACILNTTRMKK